MAYMAQKSGGLWEIRESISTPKGPRSRTLASFRTLGPETIEHARRRATRPVSADELREAARRAGAPVELPPVDRAAAELIRELVAGRKPRPVLAKVLVDALRHGAGDPRLREIVEASRAKDGPPGDRRETRAPTAPEAEADPTDAPGSAPRAEPHQPESRDSVVELSNARSSAAWLTAPVERRSETLWDLLELADALPQGRAGQPLKFPRIGSKAAGDPQRQPEILL